MTLQKENNMDSYKNNVIADGGRTEEGGEEGGASVSSNDHSISGGSGQMITVSHRGGLAIDYGVT